MVVATHRSCPLLRTIEVASLPSSLFPLAALFLTNAWRLALVLVLLLLLLLQHTHTHIQKFLHDRPRIGSLVPEAAMIILVGMIAGYLLHFVVHTDTAYYNAEVAADADGAENADADNGYEDVAASIFSFSPTIFFIILLPPIIFNSGYHLQRDLFFRYIAPICLYACVGTAVCTLVMACLLYALSSVFATVGVFAPTFLELLAFASLLSATDPVS